MNILRAFMELDKLQEGYDDRQTLINNLKSIGRNYKFEKYSTPQLFYIWQKESAKHSAAKSVAKDDFVALEPSPVRATCGECGCALTDGGFCPVCDDGAEDITESVKSEYHCSECGFTGLFYDEEVADGCCPNCHDHHGGFVKCDESLKENWADEKLAELKQKPRYAWTEEDWEAYNYCMNANAEVDYYDSLDEAAANWVSRPPVNSKASIQAVSHANPNQVGKIPVTRYALAIEEPINKLDPVFFYFDSDDDDYTRDDLETAYEENEYCVFDTLDEALKEAVQFQRDYGEVHIVGVDRDLNVISSTEAINYPAFNDYYDKVYGLSEDFFDAFSEKPMTRGWTSRSAVNNNTTNPPAAPPATTTPPPTPAAKQSASGANIVTIVYDTKAHKLRARADDGVHGEANVAFPNNLRTNEGQQYEVDDLIWNGKNYRVSGNIVAI